MNMSVTLRQLKSVFVQSKDANLNHLGFPIGFSDLSFDHRRVVEHFVTVRRRCPSDVQGEPVTLLRQRNASVTTRPDR